MVKYNSHENLLNLKRRWETLEQICIILLDMDNNIKLIHVIVYLMVTIQI